MLTRLFSNPFVIAAGQRLASDIIEIGITGLLDKTFDSIALKIIEEEKRNESTNKTNR